MRTYETGFLIAPAMTDEEAEALVQSLAETVAQKNGRMIRIEKWGKRRTSYPIGKAHEAFYVFFHYESGPEVPAELARRFRQMDTILRHLSLVKEAQQNVRKKKKVKAQPAAAEPQPAEAPAETRKEG
jgi:small subunit ribosomal protein S6